MLVRIINCEVVWKNNLDYFSLKEKTINFTKSLADNPLFKAHPETLDPKFSPLCSHLARGSRWQKPGDRKLLVGWPVGRPRDVILINTNPFSLPFHPAPEKSSDGVCASDPFFFTFAPCRTLWIRQLAKPSRVVLALLARGPRCCPRLIFSHLACY